MRYSVSFPGVKGEGSRPHWIVRTAFEIAPKRAEPPLLILGRRPSRPFFLVTDCGHARRGLTILSHYRAIANRLAFGQYVVDIPGIGIDQDRAWRFLPVVLNDLTLIGEESSPVYRVGSPVPAYRAR